MRKNSQRIIAGALMLTVLVSTGCSVQNSQQTVTEQQTQQSTTSETEPETGAPVADTDETTDGVVNYGMMEDTSIKVEPIELTDEWDKVFPLSDEVNHRKVTFVNHFGNTLAADLYEPKEYTGKIPAIAVSGPFGAVKEQSSGLYAQEMAERGFLAIAFDPSFTGESGGYPRYFNSPDINVEDYQAAIDFLSTQDNVDPEQIGIIGICGWGGMALQTAALDTRVKAMAAMTMYDMSRNTALVILIPLMRTEGTSPVLLTINREQMIIKMELIRWEAAFRKKHRKKLRSMLRTMWLIIRPTVAIIPVPSIPIMGGRLPLRAL